MTHVTKLADQMLTAALEAAREKKALRPRPKKRRPMRRRPSEAVVETNGIVPGAVIRVANWPGTRGIQFEVTEITPGRAPTCHALELDGGRPWRHRAFPLENCSLDPNANQLMGVS